jgi:hypothetical protein
LLNKKKNLYSQGLINQLDSLQDNNPQAFWKLFNQIKDDQSKRNSSLASEEFVDHFKKLFQQNSKIDSNFLSEMESFISLNKNKVFNQLNMKISQKEISKSIRHLKRGKAGGPDLILNEMVKSGQKIILPVLLQLLNKILINGA